MGSESFDSILNAISLQLLKIKVVVFVITKDGLAFVSSSDNIASNLFK